MTKTPFNVRSLLVFVLFSLICVASAFTTSPLLVTSSSSREVAKPHQQLYQTSLEDKDVVDERSSGLLVLASVPLAWGTYSPVVKYVYEVDPQIPGIVFSAAYYIVATILLNGLASREQDSSSSSSGEDDEFPYMGGLELGSYLFIANAMQVKGLETVPADRAGFLVQLTTIMVPLMQAASNRVGVPLQTWIACILAFAGVIIMGLDGQTEALTATTTLEVSSISLSQGDLLIVAAAVLYSLHVVRLGQYATQTTALKLAASKATTEAILSIVVVSCLFFLGSGDVPNFVTALSSGLDSGSVTLTTLTPAICAVVWTGFVTCAYTIFAQSYGQARVGPTEANLLYTIQPLFTAVFGYLLLGETLGPSGVVGAVLIASAVYTVSSNQEDDAGIIIGDGISENELDGRSVNKTSQPVDEKILGSTKR